jgi:ADP-heptose:LPS heptosyltransferase
MIIYNFSKLKIIDYLSKYKSGAVAFIFLHGLGDFICFLPLFETLQKEFPSCKLHLYSKPFYGKIYSQCKIIPNDIRVLFRKYLYIFRVSYPELIKEERYRWTKVENCNLKEIGLNNFNWNPYNLLNGYNKESKLIGFHGFGNTNIKKKNIDLYKMEQIWCEIKELGYEPFEIHINDGNIECPYFINRNNSLRFDEPDINLFMNKIKECKYFIGVESGPFYLAGSILGFDKCIGLEKHLKFNHIPIKHNLVDINFYEKNTVKNKIKELDKLTNT